MQFGRVITVESFSDICKQLDGENLHETYFTFVCLYSIAIYRNYRCRLNVVDIIPFTTELSVNTCAQLDSSFASKLF